MATINVYLTFDGNCEKAFEFYKSVLGGEFLSKSRFSDMPPDPRFPVPEEQKSRLMHVSLPISRESVLMGSDKLSGHGPELKFGNNFSVSISVDSKGEADRVFRELGAGGQVIMPMENTFWGSYFGMFSDKFGINWMVSFSTSS